MEVLDYILKGVDGKWVQNWKHTNFFRNTVLTIKHCWEKSY